jgi:hypothetical protein
MKARGCKWDGLQPSPSDQVKALHARVKELERKIEILEAIIKGLEYLIRRNEHPHE